MDQKGIEELSRGQELFQSIHLAIERCQDCDKKQLKSSTERLGIERCRGAVEIALKTVFQEEKNRDMHAIKHATQQIIQTTF